MGEHGNLRFIVGVSLLSVFLKVVILSVSDTLFSLLGFGELVEISSDLQIPDLTIFDFFISVLAVPPIETIFGQWLPIAFASMFSKTTRVLVIFSASVFALLHYPAIAFFPGAFVVGLFLAWSWVLRRKNGRWEAFWVTTSIHMTHNLLAFLALFLLASLE